MLNRNKQRRAMAEEFAHHIELRAEELMRSGLSKEEAQRRARAEFGSIENYKEQGRQARGWLWFDDLIADLRYAVRTHKASPGFTLAAIGILAAAIGSNTALFTFYNEFVLKPIPINDAENHVVFANAHSVPGSRDRITTRRWSRAEFDLLQASLPHHRNFYAFEIVEAPMREPQPRNVRISYVSPGYMEALGAPLLMGRPLSDAEPASVLLSHASWQSLFQGDPAVIGRKMLVAGEELTIVGVTAESFMGILLWPPDIWAQMKPAMGASRTWSVGAFGPAANLAHLAKPLAESSGGKEVFHSAEAIGMPTRTTASPEFLLMSSLVFGAFFLLIVIACANLANLLLARSASRAREISIRLSLGAPRSRVIRQLLTESILLATVASIVGLAIALAAIPFAQQFLFAVVIKARFTVQSPSLDWRVFAYTAGMAFAAGILFGLAPALESTKPRLAARSRWRRARCCSSRLQHAAANAGLGDCP